MNIVIVGAKDRDSAEDITDVGTLLDLLDKKYGKFTVLTVMSHQGIGKIVRTFCQAQNGSKHHRFPMVEADVRVYAHDLKKEQMAMLYTARNAMLYEIGDLFFNFAHPQRRSVIDELVEVRAANGNRPHRTFLPGDPITIENM